VVFTTGAETAPPAPDPLDEVLPELVLPDVAPRSLPSLHPDASASARADAKCVHEGRNEWASAPRRMAENLTTAPLVYPEAMAERDDYRATLHTTTPAGPPGEGAIDPSTACLVVIYGAELGKRIPLGTGIVECGRSSDTGIPLDDDAVSRRHARFAWTGSSFLVSDRGSTNGTWVNDVMVRERTLHDGDQVKIGHTIFKFICGGNIELSYHEEIYRLMTFDGLTQVHNKRAFDAAIDREVSRAERYKRPLSLVLFDIDHFKRINDEHGHLVGDAVLRQLASVVRAHIRREDVAARVGGEEFALILPEIPGAQARQMAEKLRALVERTPFRFDERDIPVTASFGVGEFRLVPRMDVQDLYRAADERLYAAKKGGRNRVA
jgi:diguanylate cyclase (GGDEF)-like protein